MNGLVVSRGVRAVSRGSLRVVSRGNVVRPGPIADVVGTDALRYFLLREITFGQDGSFSYDALIQRVDFVAVVSGTEAPRPRHRVDHLSGREPRHPATELPEGSVRALHRVVFEVSEAGNDQDVTVGSRTRVNDEPRKHENTKKK